jgi:hypothetical protein
MKSSLSRTLAPKILAALLACGAMPGAAAEWAWVMSIPHALSGEHVYKVRILEIDGAAQQELIRYPVGPGEHSVTVELMLDLEWEPDLTEAGPVPAVKQLKLEAIAGKSYLLAGLVDVDAPAEAQLDQSYWEPVIYAVK